MTERLLLQCMGRPALSGPDGGHIRFRTRKHLGLLLYLALEPRTQWRREHLTELLWSRAERGAGRHSLATALSVLRARLGRQSFGTERETIRFTPAALSLDLDRLAADEIMGDDYTPPLEVAPLLADFDIPDAPEFMQWRDRQRARWLPKIRGALIRLIDLRRRTGAFRDIEPLADRLLELDELSEDGIRAKMEARAFDGDRLTALRLYEDWAGHLQSELQAAPSAMMEGMATRLRRRGWERPTSAPIPQVPTDQWKDRPFVGRAREYRQAYEAWESTRAGSPVHMLVLGESGVGKSTLLGRVATAAGLEGAAVSRVQCYEVERDIPYAALASLIEGLLDRPGVAATSPEALAELASLVPAIRRQFPGIPAPQDTRGDDARVRLTEAMQQLMAALTEEQPVILIVDDLHFADDASLAVLHLVLRRSSDLRLMALLAARTGELSHSPQAIRFREGHAQVPLTALSVEPLDERDMTQLLEVLLHTVPGRCTPATRKALVTAAHGFPMVLQHLVTDWAERGDQALALAVGAMTEDLTSNETSESAYRLLVERLTSQLDGPTRQVLMLASILGPRLNDLELYRLLDLGPSQTLAALADLAQKKVLRDDGRELEFTNELFRAEAYRSIPSSVRRSLHGDIARQLADGLQAGKSIPGLEISWHCIRGGEIRKGVRHLLKGAEECLNRGAPYEAERALTTGLGLFEGEEKTAAFLLLVEAQKEQAERDGALETIRAARRDGLPLDMAVFRILELECAAITEHSIIGESSDTVEELIALSHNDKPTWVRAKACFLLANIATQGRRAVSGAEVLEELRTIPRQELSLRDAGAADLAEAMLHYCLGDHSRSKATLAQARALFASHSITSISTYRLYTGTASLYVAMGRYDLACPFNYRASQIARTMGNPLMDLRGEANLSLCYRRLGRFDDAVQRFSLSEILEAGIEAPRPANDLLSNLAVCYGMLGRQEEALRVVDAHSRYFPQDYPIWLTQGWYLLKADGLFAAGKREDAIAAALVAVQGQGNTLHSTIFAGRYARWVSVLGRETLLRDGVDILKPLENPQLNLDFVDRTELYYALRALGGSPRPSMLTPDVTIPDGLRLELHRYELLPL